MYNFFAKVYDELMIDVPYGVWVDFVNQNAKTGSSILDLGCGTGTIAVELAKAGYFVSGLDLSSEMLTYAKQKAAENDVNVSFYEGSMTDFENVNNFDVIVSFVDSLNYLTSVDDLKKTFENCYSSLKNNGHLLFDLHTLYKLNNVFDGFSYSDASEELSMIWNSHVNESDSTVLHELTFFKPTNEDCTNYLRYDELHVQKIYDIEMVENMLKQIGFVNIDVLYDIDDELQPKNEPIRAFVKAQVIK